MCDHNPENVFDNPRQSVTFICFSFADLPKSEDLGRIEAQGGAPERRAATVKTRFKTLGCVKHLHEFHELLPSVQHCMVVSVHHVIIANVVNLRDHVK